MTTLNAVAYYHATFPNVLYECSQATIMNRLAFKEVIAQ